MKEKPEVKPEACMACELCIGICPFQVIALKNGVAVIDSEPCGNCRICEMVCPVGAIH